MSRANIQVGQLNMNPLLQEERHSPVLPHDYGHTLYIIYLIIDVLQ